MNTNDTREAHLQAIAWWLNDPDRTDEQLEKQFPRTYNALKTGDFNSFDLPEPPPEPELDFPIKIEEYLHGSKFTEDDRFNELVEEGYDEKWLETNFRYLIYELKLDLELRKDGEVYITHVAGEELNSPIKAT